MKGVLLKILCLGLVCFVGSNAEPSEYSYGLMKIFLGDPVKSQKDGQEFCITYPSQYFSLPDTPTKFFKLQNVTDVNACEDYVPPVAVKEGTLLLMMSTPNCSLSNYVNYTKSASASGLVLISNAKRIVNQNFSLDALVLINNATANEISAFLANVVDAEVQLYSPDDNDFEGSIVLLWLVACLCVAIGSLSGGSYQDLQSNSSRQQILDNSDGAHQEPKNVQISFSVTLVLTLVLFISATLLLLYFFYGYLVYFFMVVFCIASGRATYDILNQVLNLCKLDQRMPRIKDCGIHHILVAGVCIALPVTWFVLRHDPYIWILQDILGVCFCVHLIQTLRIPNLKICTVLLSLLFVYDIFFVFITPFFTSDGKSVMVEVATGGDSEESLPLLIKFPHLKRGPYAVCSPGGYSLLGFGDIIVPGFLVCFANAFDVVRGNRSRPYFITAMIGYAVGLCIAFIALYLSQTGQPALLYIVPATLIPIYAVGFFKNDVRNLWKGTISITEVEP